MSRYEELEKLKKLEATATPGKWFVEHCKYQWDLYAENHDLEGSCPPDTPPGLKEILSAHPWKLISANKNGYWPEGSDSDIIPALRNAAPWLLAVASCFREDDANLLGRLAYEEADMERFRAGFGTPDTQMSDMLRRMQEAALLMEEKA